MPTQEQIEQKEKVQKILVNHAAAVLQTYHEKWVPKTDNISEAYSLFNAPEGFTPYTFEEIIQRQKAFWKCKEDWVKTCKHNFSVFVKHIHRWLPAQNRPPLNPLLNKEGKAAGVYRCDCGNELLMDEVCLKCFPVCDNCGYQHLPSENCNDFVQRANEIKKIFNKRENRISGTTNIKDFLK